MPVYEYECVSCGARFDKRQGFEEKPEVLCPKCRCPVRRVIRPAPIIFKGSGFYVTDHRKPDASDNGKDKASAASTATTTSTPGTPGTASTASTAGTASTPSPVSPPKSEASEKSGKK